MVPTKASRTVPAMTGTVLPGREIRPPGGTVPPIGGTVVPAMAGTASGWNRSRGGAREGHET